MRNSLKILYACNDLDYFIAHRWFLAQAMTDKGWQVSLSTGIEQNSKGTPENTAVKVLKVELDRHRLNLLSDFGLIRSYLNQIKTEKPDVIHAITIKPILFMGLALLISKLLSRKTPKLILTYPGLGKVFEPDTNFKAKIRKFIVSNLLGLSNRFIKPEATFENYASMEELTQEQVVAPDCSSIVMGAGIDRELFYSQDREGSLVVLFASRLLNAKGLGEFIEAAHNLRKDYPNVIFQVAGKYETENPDAFALAEIMSANDKGIIEYLGTIDLENMPQVLRQSDILVAPSKLKEGLPRVVLEAASCGCCIIASDHEMLRQFVIENETGWLLDEVNARLIEERLRIALSNPKSTRAMGRFVATKMNNLPIFEDNLIAHFEKLYEA